MCGFSLFVCCWVVVVVVFLFFFEGGGGGGVVNDIVILLVCGHTARQQRRDRQRLVVYSKMFTAMGFTWAAGFAAAFTEEVALWWVYILLNGLQGTFIAFSFVLNARFVRALKAKFMAKKKDHGGVGSVDKGRGLSVGRCQNGACRNGVGGGGDWARGEGCSDGNDGIGSGCDDWSGPRCDVHILSASSLTVETNVDM